MSNPDGPVHGAIRWKRALLLGFALAIPIGAGAGYSLLRHEDASHTSRRPNRISMLLGNLKKRWFPPPAPQTYTVQATLHVPIDPAVDLVTHQKAQVSMVRSERVLGLVLLTHRNVTLPGVTKEKPLILRLQEELDVDFSEGPEVLRIRMTGKAPAEMAALVNAVAVRYVLERHDQVPASLRPALRDRAEAPVPKDERNWLTFGVAGMVALCMLISVFTWRRLRAKSRRLASVGK